jgi:hypothetical protein
MATQKWCSKRNNFATYPEHDTKLLTYKQRGDTMSYEPQLDDDIALGYDDEEELDEEFDEMIEIALER